MKTITIKQPWASLICQGIKDIENRTWATKFRGRVLVHAAAKSWRWSQVLSYISDEMAWALHKNGASKKWLDSLETGAIIGSVEIVDCVINHASIWAEKSKQAQMGKLVIQQEKTTYNWVLANPIRFPKPIPIKGRLGFWDYPNILSKPEEEGGELFCHCQLPVEEKNQVYSMIDHYRCHYCGGKWYK